jgi:hypothetical protein
MASKSQNPGETIEKQHEETRKTKSQETSQRLAASESGRIQVGKTAPAFIDRILDRDITTDNEDDDLDDELVTESSRANALGNVDEREYHRKKIENEHNIRKLVYDLPAQNGPGSKFKGELRDIVRGDEEDLPVLTDRTERRIMSAISVVNSRLSLSKNGFLINALTKIQAVTETNPRDEAASPGRVKQATSKVKSLLSPG